MDLFDMVTAERMLARLAGLVFDPPRFYPAGVRIVVLRVVYSAL